MKYYIIVLILSVLLFGGFLYEKEILFNDDEKIGIVTRNITKKTNINENIKSDIGDSIKYDLIVSPKNKSQKLNIDPIINKIDIDNITINGEKNDIDSLKNTYFDKTTIVTIEGKLKKDGDIIVDEIEIIDIKNINENKVKEEAEISVNDNIIQEKYKFVLNNLNYSSNINNLLEIKGEYINKIDFVTIGELSFKPNIDNNKGYILINKASFSSGSYFIIIQMKDGTIIPLSNKINFEYSDAKISVANITPNKISNKNNTYIILQGEGFEKTISIQLSNNLVLKETNYKIINNNVLSVLIPKDIDAGIYTLNIMDTSGIYKINKNITIK